MCSRGEGGQGAVGGVQVVVGCGQAVVGGFDGGWKGGPAVNEKLDGLGAVGQTPV